MSWRPEPSPGTPGDGVPVGTGLPVEDVRFLLGRGWTTPPPWYRLVVAPAAGAPGGPPPGGDLGEYEPLFRGARLREVADGHAARWRDGSHSAWYVILLMEMHVGRDGRIGVGSLPLTKRDGTLYRPRRLATLWAPKEARLMTAALALCAGVLTEMGGVRAVVVRSSWSGLDGVDITRPGRPATPAVADAVSVESRLDVADLRDAGGAAHVGDVLAAMTGTDAVTAAR